MDSSDFLATTLWDGWRRWVAWLICLSAIIALGTIRTSTDGEFSLSTLALLPVLFIAWIGGRKGGLLVAFVAAAMWTLGDIATERQFTASWIPWANSATRLLTYSLVALLVAQLRLQFQWEHKHATRDALTGLRNRRDFLRAGDAEVDRSRRYAHSLAVAFLDLDDFKQVNDSRGHAAGDAALRATAGALRGALRSSDRVARLGGDEFAILLPEIGHDAALETGRKISSAVNDALRDFPPVRVSVGVAWFATVDRDFRGMVKAADELMYEVKKGGKNDVRLKRFEAIDMPQTEYQRAMK